MTNLIFKDNSIRTNGNLVCLTDMAKPYAKTVGTWNQLKASQKYLNALSVVIGIPITNLIDISDKGTFAHPEVAIHFAQWLSPEFHVWCNLLQETQVNLIQQEMLAGTHYKEIFRLVKNRILKK